MLKKPFSLFINKFKETRFDDGSVDTQFGTYKLMNESFSLKIMEVYLEDLTPEQMAQVKVGNNFSFQFDNQEVTHKETEKIYILNTKEEIVFEIKEVLDVSAASSGSILVRVDEVIDFE